MPAKSERTKVEIKESSTLDVRTINITLTIPTTEFQLADVLRQRGVIHGLDVELKQAVKRGTESYLKAAESLISGLTSKRKATRKARSIANASANSAKSGSDT